jgi:hypothetical protein
LKERFPSTQFFCSQSRVRSNRTIASCKLGSLARSENKNVFTCFANRSSLLHTSVLVVNSIALGLATGAGSYDRELQRQRCKTLPTMLREA